MFKKTPASYRSVIVIVCFALQVHQTCTPPLLPHFRMPGTHVLGVDLIEPSVTRVCSNLQSHLTEFTLQAIRIKSIRQHLIIHYF